MRPDRRPSHRTARLAGREDLTDSLAIFRIEPEGGVPAFEAGQHLLLGLEPPAGRALWRAYSIASPPEETRHLELYVRLARPPLGRGFTESLWRLPLGSLLLFRPPRGTFTIAERRPDGTPDRRRLLLAGAGTGLAPFVSMTLHLHRVGTSRELVVCHGARAVDELGYRALLERLARERADAAGRPFRMRYVPTVSRPDDPRNAGWTGRTGRVETLLRRGPAGRSALEEEIGAAIGPEDTSIYACGFAGTVRDIVAAAGAIGFRTAREPRPDGSFDLRWESFG